MKLYYSLLVFSSPWWLCASHQRIRKHKKVVKVFGGVLNEKQLVRELKDYNEDALFFRTLEEAMSMSPEMSMPVSGSPLAPTPSPFPVPTSAPNGRPPNSTPSTPSTPSPGETPTPTNIDDVATAPPTDTDGERNLSSATSILMSSTRYLVCAYVISIGLL